MAAVAADLAALRVAVDEVPELGKALASPEIDAAAKRSLLVQLTGDAHPLVGNFLQVLLDRGRIGEAGPMAAAFARRVDQAEGRFEVTAITAVPLTDELRTKLAERIRRSTGRTASITERVDADIIGGLVLEAGEVRVDGSVRGRLAGLRSRLTKAPVPVGAAGRS